MASNFFRPFQFFFEQVFFGSPLERQDLELMEVRDAF